MYISINGYCNICQKNVIFQSETEWLRDNFKCGNCKSIPREIALMRVIETYYPNFRMLLIHESSPANRGVSSKLKAECPGYVGTQFFSDVKLGEYKNNVRCENLESLTYKNNEFDLHITQDVMEHVFDTPKAFSEINRTLKPGGAHIFTVPLVKRVVPSELRAKRDEFGYVVHLLPEVYHGNPVSNNGSLVVTDWGYDICRYIFEETGCFSQHIIINDLHAGIRAELIDVILTRKNNN